MAPVDNRDYVLSGIYYSVLKPRRCAKHNVANTSSKHETLTQCWSNAGPLSATLAQHQTSTGSTPRVCWDAFNSNSALVSTSCWRYRHNALNQSWVNVGPPSVTLAHIQRGAKHDTVTQYWAKHWVNVLCLTTCAIESPGQK